MDVLPDNVIIYRSLFSSRSGRWGRSVAVAQSAAHLGLRAPSRGPGAWGEPTAARSTAGGATSAHVFLVATLRRNRWAKDALCVKEAV